MTLSIRKCGNKYVNVKYDNKSTQKVVEVTVIMVIQTAGTALFIIRIVLWIEVLLLIIIKITVITSIITAMLVVGVEAAVVAIMVIMK